MSGFGLKLKILTDIISPAVEETRLREQAQTLGFRGPLTPSQVDQLQNAVMIDLLDKIKAFLLSEDARQLYRHAALISARPSFYRVIQEKLDSRIQAIFQLAPPEPSFWRWAVSWIKT